MAEPYTSPRCPKCKVGLARPQYDDLCEDCWEDATPLPHSAYLRARVISELDPARTKEGLHGDDRRRRGIDHGNNPD